jgi:hypothetical protein
MKVGGRTTAFPLILLHSLAWINLAQNILEQSKGIRVFQGLSNDYFGAAVASNTLAGDGLFFMLDADIDTRILFWAFTAAIFNPAISPTLAASDPVADRALESAGLSALILWAKERSAGAIFHVVMRLVLDQWLGSAAISITADASNRIKVTFPMPGTEDAYSLALQHVGDDVLIAWCFMHAQQTLSSVTAFGDNYSMEVWVGDHKRVETPSVGATLRGEANQNSRTLAFNLLRVMIDSPWVKNHAEIRRLTTDSNVTPLQIVDRVVDKAEVITCHKTTVLLQPIAIPRGVDLKKGSEAILDFEVSSKWVLDNVSSIPCPSAPEESFPNAAELGHGSAACVFIKPADVSGTQADWVTSLLSGGVSTDTVDVSRGPAYGVNIKVTDKPNVSGKYSVAQLVGNLDTKLARQSPVFDRIRDKIAAAISGVSPGIADAYSFVITQSSIDPDTNVVTDTGWFLVPADISVDVSDIIHTDVSSQLSVDVAVPAGSVCKVIRTTDSSTHTVTYAVSPFTSDVYTGLSPIPENPYDAFKYIKLVWTTRTSPAQRVSGVFTLDKWNEYACKQLDAFYKRVSTVVKDSQNDVSSGNNNPQTVGTNDDDKTWLWILLLLLLVASMNNSTNITVKLDRNNSHPSEPESPSESVPVPDTRESESVSESETAAELGRTGEAANPNKTVTDKPQLRR